LLPSIGAGAPQAPADRTAGARLRLATGWLIQSSARVPAKGDIISTPEFDQVEHVRVENLSQARAFFVRLRVMKGADGGDVAPILWEDNYFALMPGEERAVSAAFARNRPAAPGHRSGWTDGTPARR
jgi:hypothetical protein